MSEEETDQEPSIEEILSSIRQIISDDDEDETAAEEAVEEDPTPEPEPEPEPVVAEEEPEPEPEPVVAEAEDVLDLTEILESDDIMPEPERVELDLSDPDEEEEPEPEPEPEPAEIPDSLGSDDSIFTDTAAGAAFEGFSKLAHHVPIGRDGISLEEIVREMLKPMVRDWLDKNLPKIIEKLVKEELQRISKQALDD